MLSSIKKSFWEYLLLAPALLFENSFSSVCEVYFVEACMLRRLPVPSLPLLGLDFFDFFGEFDFDFEGETAAGISYSFTGAEMSISLFS